MYGQSVTYDCVRLIVMHAVLSRNIFACGETQY